MEAAYPMPDLITVSYLPIPHEFEWKGPQPTDRGGELEHEEEFLFRTRCRRRPPRLSGGSVDITDEKHRSRSIDAWRDAA
jgi:hypothetical protein